MNSQLKDRLRIACGILCGHISLANDGDEKNGVQYFQCNREHIAPKNVQIPKDKLDELNQSADELKFAVGYIANSENSGKYNQVVNDRLTNISK